MCFGVSAISCAESDRLSLLLLRFSLISVQLAIIPSIAKHTDILTSSQWDDRSELPVHPHTTSP